MYQIQLYSHSCQNFICNNCQKKFYNEETYSPTQNSGFLEETYCSNCVEIIDQKKPKIKKPKSWGSAPIHETTENIQSLNLDKRTLKKTGRVHLFATRVKKEWIEQLKSIAYEERLKYVEVLEKALECYIKHQKKQKLN